MSFWHSVFDGTGADSILEAVAECCKAANEEHETPFVQSLAKTHVYLRNMVSTFPSKRTHLDHSVELGTPIFNPNSSTEHRVQSPRPKTYLGNSISPIHDEIYFEDMAGHTGDDADLPHLVHLTLGFRTKLASMDETLMYSASADYDDWTKIEAGPAGIIATSWRGLKVF
ncbi:hypothetical protein BO94DRAFT_589644 [Aspergillus sclerotioniger CBS 115572]|uniref:Uncharacterized protein n=1 Tax=Aspergillus sclerotioniger CBS 115572 TaxID=1450535 RepID=A0A317VDP3_9EURO|nr:hypothetical protein BO94DRAFT_589644 [Aspergillus sclerotioniger CBS 115572]PWY72494.1 hypothetical protein BO94DRAFT_589644 [Aspergillus sclerotioniger CBS 115572]